jgi:hypothetical protein
VKAYHKLYVNTNIVVYWGEISVEILAKLFENCIRGYIMTAQKGDRSRFEGAKEEKEV